MKLCCQRKKMKSDFLKQVLIFNEFTEDELIEIAKRLNTEYVQAGEVIFRQGDARDNVYMIQDGEVQCDTA